VKLGFYITGPSTEAVKGAALNLDRFGDGDANIFYQRPAEDSVLREEAPPARDRHARRVVVWASPASG
jgi:hypothetical protein